jgi:hypothetical protein
MVAIGEAVHDRRCREQQDRPPDTASGQRLIALGVRGSRVVRFVDDHESCAKFGGRGTAQCIDAREPDGDTRSSGGALPLLAQSGGREDVGV